MKSINKKVITLIGGLLLLVAAMCGCDNKASDKNAKQTEASGEEIVIWAWDATFNVKAASLAAAEYQKKHPDIHIVIETREREEILADTKNIIAAKVYDKLPDIIMIEDYDVQEVLSIYADEFVDLTNIVSYDKFADYKSELCSKNGRMYGIPFDSGAAALFYRVDILEDAGFTEADMQNLTWDRYIEIGCEVYKKTGIPMMTLDPTDFPQIRLIMQSCGSWYVTRDGKVNIEDNEALRQALEVYEKLLETDIGVSVNGWNEFISAFQNGEVATVMSGCWIVSSIEASEEQVGLWRATEIPVLSENSNAVAASNVGGSSWYVLKNSKNSEAATEFLVSMFSENDEFIDSLINEIGLIPAVKDPTVFMSYESQKKFWGGQQVTKLLADLADKIPTVNYGSNTYEIEDILEDEFQNALVDGELKQCLKRVQAKAEAVVNN